MKNIHFGAGNIGRGFIAPILYASGANITFIDINKTVIESLNKEKSYEVEVLGINVSKTTISNVQGLLITIDNSQVIASANLITTAVGANVLPKIAKTLANALYYKYQQNHREFLNIMACENMLNATLILKDYIFQELPEEAKAFVEQYVGFVNCVVDRIVPPQDHGADVLKVSVEDFYEWVADVTHIKGEVPQIVGIIFTDSLSKYVERKIFTLNTGHAVTAYLGYLKNKATILEAIADPDILHITKGVMEESAGVLIKKYNINAKEHNAYINKIIQRFQNPYLQDEVTRVAREPLRKLGREERFIMPLQGTLDYHLPNDNLIFAIACVFAYSYAKDSQAIELQSLIRQHGLQEAITDVTGLKDHGIINKIVAAFSIIPNFAKG